MRRMASRSMARCLALPLLVAACASLGGVEPPEVSLVGLEPLPGGALEQRFAVELRVLNPNERELRVDGIDFTLEVNLQDDDNGDGAIPGWPPDGLDDEFQFN